MPHLRSAALGSVVVLACLAGSSHTVRAATPLTALRYAPDITVDLSGTTVTPPEVAEDNLAGTVTLVDVGGLPADVHVDAYVVLGNGDRLLSFDTTVLLPGAVTAGPADVVRFTGATYSIAFDAIANGVPDGVNVDAVAVSGGDLLLSFDTSVALSGATFEDEDLVRFRSGVPDFVAFFTGAAAGVPGDLDLDGAQVIGPQRLLVSFDGSGNVGGVDFDDEDVLEYDGGGDTWELAYDGSAEHAGWEAGDLVALYALLAEPSPTPTATSMPPGTATQTATATPTIGTTTPTSSTPGTATPTSVATSTGSPPLTPTGTATQTATATPTTGTTTPTSSTPGTATPTSVATSTGSPPLTPTTPSGVCVGDCDGSGEVTINELIAMVNIALGNADVSTCPAGDPNGNGEVTIDELIMAVNNALNGC